jgi:WD40 repeat protein
MAGVEVTEYTKGNAKIHAVKIPELGEHVYSVKISPDGKFMALTFGNGVIRILDANTYNPLQRSKLGNPYDDLPSPMVKWGPISAKGQYSLASISSAGVVFGWEWDAGDYAERTFKLVEERNDSGVIDFSPDGKYFATAGSDRSIRIYNLAEKRLEATMSRGVDPDGHSRVAHNNRIFSVRYASTTTLLSAGWESPVQVWDLRTGKSERQVSGSQAGADSLEPIRDTTRFLVASNRNHKQLQVFDYISCNEMEQDSLRLSSNLGKAHLACTRLCYETKTVWVSCMKPPQVKQIDYSTGEVLCVVDCPGAIMGIDVSPFFPGKCFIACMNETLLIAENTGSVSKP